VVVSFGAKLSVLLVAMLPLMLSTVPGVVPQPIRSVSVKLAEPPDAKFGFVQLTVPVPPVAGVVHVQPLAADSAWNVVLAGTGNDATASGAASGPLLTTSKT
jgi:hypothetical protein